MEAISPTHFILGTKVQPQGAFIDPSADDLELLVKVKDQGQIFPKMRKKTKNWSYLRGYFTYRLHTWYQGATQ